MSSCDRKHSTTLVWRAHNRNEGKRGRTAGLRTGWQEGRQVKKGKHTPIIPSINTILQTGGTEETGPDTHAETVTTIHQKHKRQDTW